MGYSDTTYIIFDGDNDKWAYARMKGWKALENIDFDFKDAHDIGSMTDRAGNEQYVKSELLKRFKEADQVIVLIGEGTKYLYKYVRWELEVALELDLPIIAVNLNGKKEQDDELCPLIIKNKYVVHIPFKLKIIKHALDNFPPFYYKRKPEAVGPLFYKKSLYKELGI